MSALSEVAAPRPGVNEVKTRRRRFTVESSARSCGKPKPVRRQRRSVPCCAGGVYSSHLTSWRAQQQRSELLGLTPKKRRPAPKGKNPFAGKVATLEREVTWYKARAEWAEAAAPGAPGLAACGTRAGPSHPA
jgi:hypothetical protein